MQHRIKIIRKKLKKTQVEFGRIIGVKGNTVTNYESGLRTPTDAVIKSICREFGINEEWLREGRGEMFVALSRDEEISRFIGHIQSDPGDTFKKRFVSVLASLDEKDWELLEKMAIKMLKKD